MIGTAHRWVISASAASLALLLFNPLTYLTTNKCAHLIFKRDVIAEEDGRKPTWVGLLLHSIVLFLAFYGILYIDWDCS